MQVAFLFSLLPFGCRLAVRLAVANFRLKDLTWPANVRFSFRSVLIVDLRFSTNRGGMSRVLAKLRSFGQRTAIRIANNCEGGRWKRRREPYWNPTETLQHHSQKASRNYSCPPELRIPLSKKKLDIPKKIRECENEKHPRANSSQIIAPTQRKPYWNPSRTLQHHSQRFQHLFLPPRGCASHCRGKKTSRSRKNVNPTQKKTYRTNSLRHFIPTQRCPSGTLLEPYSTIPEASRTCYN